MLITRFVQWNHLAEFPLTFSKIFVSIIEEQAAVLFKNFGLMKSQPGDDESFIPLIMLSTPAGSIFGNIKGWL